MKIQLLILAVLTLLGCTPKETKETVQREFDEKYRSQYHFTPPSQWMNDPNGMVYYEGEYHLFYQYYPDSTVWGPMHWGHAVSPDMIDWEHLPVALYPDSLGYIFSGSTVVDYQNTSGLGSVEQPAMIAIFTYHDPIGAAEGKIDYQYQGIAYSLDKGRTWTKYANNPVLNNPGIIDFRDPKVSWHAPTEQWVMILAVKDHMTIFSSTNLIDWTKESEFGLNIGGHGGVWECPDLFPLKDQNGNEKWVMLVSINPGGPLGGSATQYFVGDFDGHNFTPSDTTTRWLDKGSDNYAGVTFGNIPDTDGRRLFMGWMSNWLYGQIVPTENWRSAMTIPRELLLKQVTNGYLVQSKPVKELNSLKGETKSIDNGSVTLETDSYLLEVKNVQTNQVSISFSNEKDEWLSVKIEGDNLVVDRTKSGVSFSTEFEAVHQVSLDGVKVASIQVYVDRSSIEIFINEGEIVMTEIMFPSERYNSIKIESDQSQSSITPLKSIWE